MKKKLKKRRQVITEDDSDSNAEDDFVVSDGKVSEDEEGEKVRRNDLRVYEIRYNDWYVYLRVVLYCFIV